MRIERMRRPGWTLTMAALLCLLLAACGDDGGETPGAEPAEGAATGEAEPAGTEEEPAAGGGATETAAAAGEGPDCTDIGTVSMGLTNSVSDAPFIIADAKGYFEEAGIDAELTTFDSGARMIAPLGSGQLDVGAGAPSAGFYNALTRDLNFRIVADKGSMPQGYGYFPLLVRADLYESGEVTEPADLAGLTVAEAAQGIAGSSTLNTILETGGLTYDDVEHEFIGFGEHLTAYANGAIDASLTTEPSATLIEDQGLAVRLGDVSEYYPNQQLAVILYGGQFINRDDDAGVCTMIAYLKGARDYVNALENGALTGEGAEEIVEIVSSATGVDPELYRRITPNWVDPDGRVNMESIEKDYQFLKDQGVLEGDVDLSQVVDPSFAEAAVEELGEWEGERP